MSTRGLFTGCVMFAGWTLKPRTPRYVVPAMSPCTHPALACARVPGPASTVPLGGCCARRACKDIKHRVEVVPMQLLVFFHDDISDESVPSASLDLRQGLGLGHNVPFADRVFHRSILTADRTADKGQCRSIGIRRDVARRVGDRTLQSGVFLLKTSREIQRIGTLGRDAMPTTATEHPSATDPSTVDRLATELSMTHIGVAGGSEQKVTLAMAPPLLTWAFA